MNNIEIGMTVVGKLYLHCVGLDLPTAFDIMKIKEVAETELGGACIIYEYTNKDGNAFVNPCIVEEEKADIEDAIKQAASYRDAAIETINSLVEKSQ